LKINGTVALASEGIIGALSLRPMDLGMKLMLFLCFMIQLKVNLDEQPDGSDVGKTKFQFA